MPKSLQQYENIILFDGVCNFCNYWVNIIIDKDKKQLYKFASLQSDTGQKLLQQTGFRSDSLFTFILFEKDNYFIKSTAAFKIASNISGWPKIFSFFIIIPVFIRDFIYDVIAKNRYRFFGKRDSCRIPTEAEKQRFIDL